VNDSTACLIARDEAPYLVEWLAHYLSLGFDRIVVYDNGSTDRSLELVQACARRFPNIASRPWPDRPGEAPQLSAYADAIRRCETEWIGFFDADELLVLKSHASIGEFLARYPGDAGSVAINWLLFGSSGELEYRDELQSLRFRLAARPHPQTKNRFVKSIARASVVARVQVHSPDLVEGYQTYDDCVRPVEILGNAKTPVPSHAVAQLNHYVVRSRAEFQHKRARGNATRAPESPERHAFRANDEFWNTHDTSHVPDAAIDPWIERAAPWREALRATLAEAGRG
jgi:glycosyltransferase involved in cell wall biosynthesis